MPTRLPTGSSRFPIHQVGNTRLVDWIRIFGVITVFLLTAACGWASGKAPPDLSGYPWLYLRAGLPLQGDEPVLELLAVGDLMLGRDGEGLEDPFDGSAAWLSQADLTMGNLEGVVGESAGEATSAEAIYLVIPPSAIEQASQAGFDLLGLANNHAFDQGSAGLQQTVESLQRFDMIPLGVFRSGDPAVYYQIYELDDHRLAFLAVNTVSSPDSIEAASQPVKPGDLQILAWDPQLIPEQVRLASQYVDAVIVSIHWGYEYQGRHDPAQEAIAQMLVEAGADLVIGHHPHTLQDTQLFVQADSGRPAFCAYSLGNFVSDQLQSETRLGLALRLWFDQDGLRAVQALPVNAGPRPHLLSPEAALPMLSGLAPQFPTLAVTCSGADCTAAPSSEPPVDGIFTSGSIDLTGDGIDEIIRLKERTVTIFQDGKPAWQSPPEWQVLDVALGDPNDDGRFEALLALEKPDDTGVIRSHPFIIGYRGGIYRQVWGGSAVSENIREVELADVTGDGVQDLLVLDEAPGQALQTVGVWEWNGWGFNLSWRSQPGRFSNLGLPASANSNSVFQVSFIP